MFRDPIYGENCRLLMHICSNASVTCDVPMVHSMRLLTFHLYIYGDEPLKSMKLPMDFSSVTQIISPIVISSPSHVYRPAKVEKLWREAFRSLYNYLSLMDIMCLKTTFVLTYQVS